MAGAPLQETSGENRYHRLQRIVLVVGVLTLGAAIGAGFVAFQRDTLLGIATSLAGLIVLGILFALYEVVRMVAAIEENTRRASSLTPYTMQMTHGMNSIKNELEEMGRNLQIVSYNTQALTEKMHTITSDMQVATEKLQDIAMYSRTTAVLLHFQSKQSPQHAPAHNGDLAYDQAAEQAAQADVPAPAAQAAEPLTGEDIISDEAACQPGSNGEHAPEHHPDDQLSYRELS
jgi:hypothetical protein